MMFHEWISPGSEAKEREISNMAERRSTSSAGERKVNLADAGKVKIEVPRPSDSTFACEQSSGGAQ
jgi:hypothetical protein